MSSRSGKSTPAKLVDSPDDIRRRRELAERKMRERHDIIKREHSDKIRKDLEDHARLQKELKEKEARELRRQQEIMQKNLERLSRDDERRKELLARNHAATSRTAAIRNVAFGSSTPRELSYLDRLPKSQKTYDKKLSPQPARDTDVRTPNKSAGSAKRSLMVSSMYIPSPRSVKASPASKPSTPKTSNLMTQSVYSTRTTSSAGYARTDRTTPTPKARVPRTSQLGTTASGKPPLPSNLKFSKRVLDTNGKNESINPKSPTRHSKLQEETLNETVCKPREVEESIAERVQTESNRIEEQPGELIVEELKSEEIFEQEEVSKSQITPSLEPIVVKSEDSHESCAASTPEVTEHSPEKIIPVPTVVIAQPTDVEDETAEPVPEPTENVMISKQEPTESKNVVPESEEVNPGPTEEQLLTSTLEQEIADLQIEKTESIAEGESLEMELAKSRPVENTVQEALYEASLDSVEQQKDSEDIHEDNVKEATPEPIVKETQLEQVLGFPVVEQAEAASLSLAQELGESLFEPLGDESNDIKPTLNTSESVVVAKSDNVAFNLNDTEYEAMDTAPAEPICSKPSSSEINVGNSSAGEQTPIVVDENNKDLTTNLLDLEEVSESPAEQTVLSVANRAFDIAQTTNPTDFTPINEHPTALVDENETKPSNPEILNDTSNEMDISEVEPAQEKPEVLPEADQVKISSLPPSPPIQQKSRESDENSSDEPQKKESDVRARLAAVLSKTREQGRLSPTEKTPVVEATVAPPATAVKFSPSTAALLQKLKNSGRASDKLSNLITKHGSEPTLEDNPEDPRHGRDLLD